jgi:hypothetical protein
MSSAALPIDNVHDLDEFVPRTSWRACSMLGCDMPVVRSELLPGWPHSASRCRRGIRPAPAATASPLRPGGERRNRGGAGAASPLREPIASLKPRVVSEAALRRFGEPALLCFNVNSPQDPRTAWTHRRSNRYHGGTASKTLSQAGPAVR